MTTRLNARIISALRRWSRGETHRNAVARRWQFLQAELSGNSRPAARRTGRHRAGPPRHRRPHWWDTPTRAYPQVGRAGRLTLAQAWRANGGQWGHQPATGKQ
ncbi:MAG TPA: hypothetical protein VFX60_04750 [Micromonospora sp.]|nr:hypothetical protein [Micromonospora sp.]